MDSSKELKDVRHEAEYNWQLIADLTGCGKLHGNEGPAPLVREMIKAFKDRLHKALKASQDLEDQFDPHMSLESIVGTLLETIKRQNKEIGEFQNDVLTVLLETLDEEGIENANIDGGGCDSGDWRDFTLSEIRQGLNRLVEHSHEITPPSADLQAIALRLDLPEDRASRKAIVTSIVSLQDRVRQMSREIEELRGALSEASVDPSRLANQRAPVSERERHAAIRQECLRLVDEVGPEEAGRRLGKTPEAAVVMARRTRKENELKGKQP